MIKILTPLLHGAMGVVLQDQINSLRYDNCKFNSGFDAETGSISKVACD